MHLFSGVKKLKQYFEKKLNHAKGQNSSPLPVVGATIKKKHSD